MLLLAAYMAGTNTSHTIACLHSEALLGVAVKLPVAYLCLSVLTGLIQSLSKMSEPAPAAAAGGTMCTAICLVIYAMLREKQRDAYQAAQGHATAVLHTYSICSDSKAVCAQYITPATGKHAWLACSLSSSTFMASVHCCSAPAMLDSAPAISSQRKL